MVVTHQLREKRSCKLKLGIKRDWGCLCSSLVGTHLLAVRSRPVFLGLCVFVLCIVRQISSLCKIKLDYIDPFSSVCPDFVVRLAWQDLLFMYMSHKLFQKMWNSEHESCPVILTRTEPVHFEPGKRNIGSEIGLEQHRPTLYNWPLPLLWSWCQERPTDQTSSVLIAYLLAWSLWEEKEQRDGYFLQSNSTTSVFSSLKLWDCQNYLRNP